MKPIYELVSAAELNVGDFAQRMGGSYEEFEVSGVKLSGLFEHLIIYPTFGTKWHSTEACMSEKFLRRIPAAEDPRVLRRVAELIAGWYANETGADAKKELDGAIEQAVMELESEATDA